MVSEDHKRYRKLCDVRVEMLLKKVENLFYFMNHKKRKPMPALIFHSTVKSYLKYLPVFIA